MCYVGWYCWLKLLICKWREVKVTYATRAPWTKRRWNACGRGWRSVWVSRNPPNRPPCGWSVKWTLLTSFAWDRPQTRIGWGASIRASPSGPRCISFAYKFLQKLRNANYVGHLYLGTSNTSSPENIALTTCSSLIRVWSKLDDRGITGNGFIGFFRLFSGFFGCTRIF